MANLSILSNEIRQFENLYSLNDLHKAAGNEQKHLPANFLRTDQTKDLIKEIEKGDAGIPASKDSEELRYADLHIKKNEYTDAKIVPLKTVRGRGKKQGTYVCKELVYAYAMWISAKFHLLVIRAFDAMHLPAPESQMLTPAHQRAVQKAVAAKAYEHAEADRRKAFSQIWSEVKDQFEVGEYKDIPDESFTDVVQFIESMKVKPRNALVSLEPTEEDRTHFAAQAALSSALQALTNKSVVAVASDDIFKVVDTLQKCHKLFEKLAQSLNAQIDNPIDKSLTNRILDSLDAGIGGRH